MYRKNLYIGIVVGRTQEPKRLHGAGKLTTYVLTIRLAFRIIQVQRHSLKTTNSILIHVHVHRLVLSLL
jgi:hypothetical protein